MDWLSFRKKYMNTLLATFVTGLVTDENEDFYFDFYEAILRQEIKRVEIKFLRDGKHHIYIYHFIP